MHRQLRQPQPPWHILQQGQGRLVVQEYGWQLLVPPSHARQYSNAQIDDYTGRSRQQLPWYPPLRMTLQARFPTPLNGTAGFGFWNSPISPLGSRPSLPATLWFFHASPPSNLAPKLGVAGAGWKAACMEARSRAARAWLPLAPLVVLLNQFPRLRQRIWPRVARSLRIAECELGLPQPHWQTYTIEWLPHQATWSIDGRIVLQTNTPPDGPLGFVAWVDTQWMRATPWGDLGWGFLTTKQPQWLDIADLQIEPLVGANPHA
ncbi:MAG: hypothetical protein Fur005_26410 [Roseiflexaceae bacterium]